MRNGQTFFPLGSVPMSTKWSWACYYLYISHADKKIELSLFGPGCSYLSTLAELFELSKSDWQNAQRTTSPYSKVELYETV